MRVLWSIHLYPPHHNCGSEYVAHHVNKYLVSKGHHVRVMLHRDNGIKFPYEYEGVEVFRASPSVDAYRWADVICTHLDFTQYTICMADLAKRPLVHFVHNDTPYTSIQNAFNKNYAVYNSEWIANKLEYKWPSYVLRPPCDFDYYNVNENPEENEYITLINLDKNKGGEILNKVAKAMPERKFLGVMGSYSSPYQIGQIVEQPGNVKVVPNTPDVLSVYKQTRVLLMPSAYESWGRTATEAMCSGIPVICTPTPGLKENCADAGIYIPARAKIEEGQELDLEEYDIEPIVKAIKSLDDKKYYEKVSKKCRARAKELNPDLEQFEKFLLSCD
jgi:glycosyltransferase involved in cell wall biosynthesis